MCEDPPSTVCTSEKKYCLAEAGGGTYFRGCYDNTEDCDLYMADDSVVCTTCETDNCNDVKFDFWSQIIDESC